MSKNKYFSVGKVLTARGVFGELKIQTWTDTPEDFLLIPRLFFDVNSEPLEIVSKKIHKSHVILKIKSVKDRNSAELLRGKVIYAYREDIPIDDDRYFIEDLKNCKVIDAHDKTEYGTLKDVINTGASDIYVVSGKEGKEYLVPIIDGTVENISLEENSIYINPIKGVFNDD